MRALVLMAFLIAPTAQAQVLPDPGYDATPSVEMLNARIAWFESICTGYAISYARLNDGDMSAHQAQIAATAAETGTDILAITRLAERRALEFEVLLDIVLSAPDPANAPPEPFAEMLRYGQADCQERDLALRVLAAGLDADGLPQDAAAPPFRAALLPDPDVAYRATRIALVLDAMLDALAARDPVTDDLARIYAVLTNQAPLPEAMEPEMATPVETLAYWAARGPDRVIEDITQEELVAIVQHILDTPGNPDARHYMDLFIYNTPYGARDLITGPWSSSDPQPSAEAIVAEAMRD